MDSKDQESPSLYESHSSASRLDSDASISDKNYDLEVSLASDFEGIARIKSNLDISGLRRNIEEASRFSTPIMKIYLIK